MQAAFSVASSRCSSSTGFLFSARTGSRFPEGRLIVFDGTEEEVTVQLFDSAVLQVDDKEEIEVDGRVWYVLTKSRLVCGVCTRKASSSRKGSRTSSSVTIRPGRYFRPEPRQSVQRSFR
jgi:hypothetical protein